MSDELKQQILSYLESHNTMILGTCFQDVPWAATVFYASDDLKLYFFSAPDSRHCQNLAANPRVAATIQEDYKNWQEIKRSEEHTSELQSHHDLVCRLLLEKKKK